MSETASAGTQRSINSIVAGEVRQPTQLMVRKYRAKLRRMAVSVAAAGRRRSASINRRRLVTRHDATTPRRRPLAVTEQMPHGAVGGHSPLPAAAAEWVEL